MRVLRYIGFFIVIFTSSCKLNYSFTGASISPEITTVSVDYFPNRALLVNPGLSQELTEAIKDKFVNQTSLEIIQYDGDLQFVGEITNYRTAPAAIQGDMASQTRLTITIKVKFTNTKNPKHDFNSSFSHYADYESSKSLDEIEDQLIQEILEKITDDIFNKAVTNW